MSNSSPIDESNARRRQDVLRRRAEDAEYNAQQALASKGQYAGQVHAARQAVENVRSEWQGLYSDLEETLAETEEDLTEAQEANRTALTWLEANRYYQMTHAKPIAALRKALGLDSVTPDD